MLQDLKHGQTEALRLWDAFWGVSLWTVFPLVFHGIKGTFQLCCKGTFQLCCKDISVPPEAVPAPCLWSLRICADDSRPAQASGDLCPFCLDTWQRCLAGSSL